MRGGYDKGGAGNPRWKGGRRIRKDGYVVVYSPGHPFAYKNFVLEHRLVMEAAIGRFLEPHEVVHHKNEIKDDNRIENLELTNHAEHARMHFTGRPGRALKPRAEKERIFELYVTNSLTIRETADVIGISYGSLRNHMLHYGIPIRSRDPWWVRKAKGNRKETGERL